MPSRFETAGYDQLNTSFWSVTSDYSVAHLQGCWAKVIEWLGSLDFLTYKSSTSTYLNSSSLTALGQSTEEALYPAHAGLPVMLLQLLLPPVINYLEQH